MHFFDPTLDWPRELIQEEIPDLLYIKSDSPVDLSSHLRVSDSSNFLSGTSPWVEYVSLDSSPYLALLFIDADYVQQQPSIGQELKSICRHLGSQNVVVARYRKVQQASSIAGSYPESTFQVWCSTFRALSRQSLRPSLSAFESFAKAAAMSTTYMQSAVYRLLASESSSEPRLHELPHSLLIHHFDGMNQVARPSAASQQVLQEHSIVEKTLLNRSSTQQLTYTDTAWPAGLSLLS